ncbi:hypothetical protein RUND412_005375 [Rhizina undulata]
MASNVCKIPVIVALVIAGLIIFSTLYCLCRCICCGYACCSCCCGGCGGRRPKETSVRRGPAPIVAQPGYNEPPKYAYFEGQERSADALPIMPSLESSKRYELDVKEEHEMTAVSGGYTRSHSPVNGAWAGDQAYGGGVGRSPSPANGYSSDPAYGYLEGPRQPSPAYGDAQAYYGDQHPPRTASPAHSAYSNAAPQAHGYNQGYSQGYNQEYRDPYYQEPHGGWENTANNGFNGPPNDHYQYQQPPPSSSRYDQMYNQRRQEEWTNV